MTNGMTVLLFILVFVLASSMSASGERMRAWILAAVVLLLSSTPFMVSIHNVLLHLLTSL